MPNAIPSLAININFRIVDPQPKTNVNKNSAPNKFQYADKTTKLPHSGLQNFFIKKGGLTNKKINLITTMRNIFNLIKNFGKKPSESNDPSTPSLTKFAQFRSPNIIVNENYRPYSEETIPKKIDNEVNLQKHTKTNSDHIYVTKQHSNDNTKNNLPIKDSLPSTIDKKQNEIRNLDQKINEKIEKTNHLNAEIGSKHLETQNLSDAIKNNRLKNEELQYNIENKLAKEEKLKANIETYRARAKELNLKLENKLLQLKELDELIIKHFNDNQDVHIEKFWLNDYEHLNYFRTGATFDNYDHLHNFGFDAKVNEQQNLYSKPSNTKPLDDYKLPENNNLDSNSEYSEISDDSDLSNIEKSDVTFNEQQYLYSTPSKIKPSDHKLFENNDSDSNSEYAEISDDSDL